MIIFELLKTVAYFRAFGKTEWFELRKKWLLIFQPAVMAFSCTDLFKLYRGIDEVYVIVVVFWREFPFPKKKTNLVSSFLVIRNLLIAFLYKINIRCHFRITLLLTVKIIMLCDSGADTGHINRFHLYLLFVCFNGYSI